jgi:hypothetical protein
MSENMAFDPSNPIAVIGRACVFINDLPVPLGDAQFSFDVINGLVEFKKEGEKPICVNTASPEQMLELKNACIECWEEDEMLALKNIEKVEAEMARVGGLSSLYLQYRRNAFSHVHARAAEYVRLWKDWSPTTLTNVTTEFVP